MEKIKRYSSNCYRIDKWLNLSIRCAVGYFDLEDSGLKVYSFCYGYPNKNDDFWSYTQISKIEYDELLKLEYLDSKIALEIDKSHNKLFDTFPSTTKEYFTIFDVDKSLL